MSAGTAVDTQELFRLHYLHLVRLAMKLVDDQDSAEDVVQDVFAGLTRQPRLPDDPLVYLRRAVVNRSHSALRRRRVVRTFLGRAHVESHVEPADAPTLDRDDTTRMLALIAALPRRQREVVVPRFYEDLSIAEIAGVLHVSPGAASSALHRALEALAESAARQGDIRPTDSRDREAHRAE